MSSPIINFIIPIRHQDSADNWQALVNNLQQLINSIKNQTSPNWHCTIICNTGADIPSFDDQKITVLNVDFPVNKLYEINTDDLESHYEAIRADKGKRILTGLINNNCEFVMFVDDDDLLHHKIVEYVEHNIDENGWYFDDGFIWREGSLSVVKRSGFNHICGTSHIVKANLLTVNSTFEANNLSYIKTMFGSHIHLSNELKKQGKPLKKLPFIGAIYRIGHTDAHSKSTGIYQLFIKHKPRLVQVRELLLLLLNYRVLNNKRRKQYFGN